MSATAGALYAGAGVTQLYLGFAQADLVQKQADLQADIARFNAGLTDYDAWRQQAFGQELIARTQNEQDQILGTSKVQAAAAGVKLNEGSLAEIKAQNELNSMLNISDIVNRTSESVMGYKKQASQLRLGADLTSAAGRVQASSIRAGAIAGALETGAKYGISQMKADNPTLKSEQPKKSSYTGYSNVDLNEDYKVKLKDEEPMNFRYGLPGGY